jgi:hypothetical protein
VPGAKKSSVDAVAVKLSGLPHSGVQYLPPATSTRPSRRRVEECQLLSSLIEGSHDHVLFAGS